MISRLNQKSDILEQVFSQLKVHFSARDQDMLALFISTVYRDVAITDLLQMPQADLNGLTVSLWHESQSWKGEQAKVRVFNPDIEQDEWQSVHTVICILCRNMPFVIDTLKLIFNEHNIKVHRIFYSELAAVRCKNGKLSALNGECSNELLVYFEVDQTSLKADRDEIALNIKAALLDVSLVVDDFAALKGTLKEALEFTKKDKFNNQIKGVKEQQTFLSWMLSDHFMFVGCDQFKIVDGRFTVLSEKRLGLLKRDGFMDQLVQFESLEVLAESSLIHFSKASQRAMVHRPAYPDIVYVKRFNEVGELVCGYRFIGLYTSAVYSGSPAEIPVVSGKITNILQKSSYSKGGHYYKELSQILYTYPIEDLLLCNEKSLLENVIEILYAQERKELKLFLRSEANKQFIIATLYVPRDVYSTKVRLAFEKLICRTLDVCDSDFQTYLSESTLARLRLVLRLTTPTNGELEIQTIQDRMKQLTKRWEDELHESLTEYFSEEKGIKLSKKYNLAFPSSYQSIFTSRVAVADIERIESLYEDPTRSMTLRFYRSVEAHASELKLKLFHQDGALILSDLIPILENLGLKVAEEYPYKISPQGESAFWLYDFTLIYAQVCNFDPEAYRDLFADAFLSVWYGKAENDPFNKLILGAGLAWREISMLRAYAKYLKQLCFGFDHFSIAKTLLEHSKLVKEIVLLFKLRFDPESSCHFKKQQKLQEKILSALNDVRNLNEDRVLRKYVELIMATLRCNYFQQNAGKNKPYICFKFAHSKISDIPLPRLDYEVFVYSPRVEGVHLRGGKVARGGLRWSDRSEDFRTEVLGLVKAQQVKNSVIVPVGAKGGFVAKNIGQAMDRESFIREGVSCYKIFIRALLDITDNLFQGEIVPPVDVLRYDGDDPYLVVAADKGTATFSDIANELAVQRNFWLNDAFASGGSNGYDHKKMGITARGAWISVQRHFRELGLDVQKQAVSVIGIGDMGGDVFGNGMLSSKYISLLGAFNHLHIFIDPNPVNLDACFAERSRLFAMQGSSWNDYNLDLISQGGGVFERSAKSILITPEMAKRFAIKQKQLTPTDLIHILLKTVVDLLWNGGIGTYVKGSTENHADVGDKANDSLRINAAELACRVIAEGGNLGLTQRARIEYSMQGGLCFTDAIDNAGGVNCSDLEVNIKILLDKLVLNGDLTVKQRNAYLEKMTAEVAQLVLRNNYRQAQSISLSYIEGYQRLEEYRGLISDLESKGKLNRKLEFLPSDELLSDRKNCQKGLTRPSIAVMLSYAKNEMKEVLANANIAEDPYLLSEAEKIFPHSLVKRYKKELDAHPLISEIVATQVSNDLFNVMGATFAYRVVASSGCSLIELSKAWVAARDIFSLDTILLQVEALDNKVSSDVQSGLLFKLKDMVRHATRWLIRHHRDQLDTGLLIQKYQTPLNSVANDIETVLMGKAINHRCESIASLNALGVPKLLAYKLASCEQVYALLNVISVATKLSVDAHLAAQVYFFAADKLKLFEIAKQLNLLPVDNHWQSLAREAMRDDLEWQQKRICQTILLGVADGNVSQAFANWEMQHENLVQRWYKMAEELLVVKKPEFSMCQVALRELLDLSSS